MGTTPPPFSIAWQRLCVHGGHDLPIIGLAPRVAAPDNAGMRIRFVSKSWLLWLLTASAAGALQAQTVYRCQSPSGQVLFSDEPCPAGSRVERVNVQPNSIDASGDRARGWSSSPPAPAAAPPRETVRSDTADAAAADRSQSFACRQAQRDYEVTASSTANPPALIEAKRSAMFAACGLREPDRAPSELGPVFVPVPVPVPVRPVVRPRPQPVPPGPPPCPAYPGDLRRCGPGGADDALLREMRQPR